MDDKLDEGAILSADCPECEKESRLFRLARVEGYMKGCADQYGDRGMFKYVLGLNDHKGQLIIYWAKKPTEKERDIAGRAWESRVGDGSDNVVHTVKL